MLDGKHRVLFTLDDRITYIFGRVFRPPSKNRPFGSRTCLDQLNIGLVWYSDSHCSLFRYFYKKADLSSQKFDTDRHINTVENKKDLNYGLA